MMSQVLLWAVLLAAGPYSGSFTAEGTEGQGVLELKEQGGAVRGTYQLGPTRLLISGTLKGGKVDGSATLEGEPISFSVVFRVEGDGLVGEVTERDQDGQPDPYTKQVTVFRRKAAAPATGTPAAGATPAPAAQGRGGGVQAVAARVKGNFARESMRVLADGNPPLTTASLSAFAELLRMVFGAELTEAEFSETGQVFTDYYRRGDAQTQALLAGGWQSILAQLKAQKGEEQKRSIEEVRQVFADRFANGARAGVPWAVTIQAVLDKRTRTVASVTAPMPAYGKKAALRTQMTEADLEASLEMLAFMWVACGRDAALITPEAVGMVRASILQNFATFPAQLQVMFANASQVYSALRGQWQAATPAARLQLARGFSADLDALGLTVPQPRGGGDRISAGGAWADMNGKSHSEWAGEMVVGLAGSSYKSAW